MPIKCLEVTFKRLLLVGLLSITSGLRKRLMSITGFKAYKEWNKENFCEFITDYGFTVVKVNLVDGGLAPVGVLIAKKTNY